MKPHTPHEFQPGQRVEFRVFPDSGKPIRRGGIVTGPDTENAGQMIVQGDQTPEDKKADHAGEIFSVWWANGGLVCGAKAPTTKAQDAAAAASEPERFALIHRGPHTGDVIAVLAGVFGAAAAAAVCDRPLSLEDGTVAYGFQCAAGDLAAITEKINADKHTAPIFAVIDPHEGMIEDLDELNSDRDWPTLTAA